MAFAWRRCRRPAQQCQICGWRRLATAQTSSALPHAAPAAYAAEPALDPLLDPAPIPRSLLALPAGGPGLRARCSAALAEAKHAVVAHTRDLAAGGGTALVIPGGGRLVA